MTRYKRLQGVTSKLLKSLLCYSCNTCNIYLYSYSRIGVRAYI